MSNNETSKIDRLEETIAHQAMAIDELNEAVTKQWTAIDSLERKSAALVERFLALEQASDGAIENTRPPHY